MTTNDLTNSLSKGGNWQLALAARIGIPVVAIAVIFCVTRWPAAQAQPPSEAAAEAEQDRVQESIRRALQGGSEPAPHSEPLLQDVLDLIKQQGSVLDGSSLNMPDADASTTKGATGSEAYYRTAESLLKAARLLNALPKTGDTRREQLVHQMRNEARQCMIAAPR